MSTPSISARKMNPFIRLISILQLINLATLLIKIYAMLYGHWEINFVSVFALFLSLCIFVGLIMVRVMAAKRITAIAETADRIIRTGDISQRIEDPYGGQEELSLISVLNRMLDEVEMHLQAVRTVSDNIAHDLRHPLTRLRNHIEEIRVELKEEDCPEGYQKLSDLVAECDALLGTFQAILRISNIESARRHGGFREISLNGVLQDVAELYEPLAAEKQIVLHADIPSTHIVGDKDLLFQAFANLVDNAIKYTPAGGSINITIVPLEKGCKIVIADTGQGISDSHKPNVFRRFYRAEASRSQPGTGLGLSLVHAIIQLHQGTITLADNEPNGLVVTVTL